MTDQPEESDYRVPVQVHKTWWAPLVAGVALLFVSWNQFREFQELETGSRDSVFVSAYQKLLYSVGGKWTAVGFLLAPALALCGVGIKRLLQDRRGLT